MEPLPRSWLTMVSLCTILHSHGILAKIMARLWQDFGKCDAMMHVLKDFINLKYSELLTEEISKSN